MARKSSLPNSRVFTKEAAAFGDVVVVEVSTDSGADSTAGDIAGNTTDSFRAILFYRPVPVDLSLCL